MGSVFPGWRKQMPPSDRVRQVSDTKGAMKAMKIWGGAWDVDGAANPIQGARDSSAGEYT